MSSKKDQTEETQGQQPEEWQLVFGKATPEAIAGVQHMLKVEPRVFALQLAFSGMHGSVDAETAICNINNAACEVFPEHSEVLESPWGPMATITDTNPAMPYIQVLNAVRNEFRRRGL